MPSFKKGTINIDDRQRGRLRAASVIDCEPDQDSIRKALKQLYSSEFQKLLTTVENPYSEGGATERIAKILEGASVNVLLKKGFFDLH